MAGLQWRVGVATVSTGERMVVLILTSDDGLFKAEELLGADAARHMAAGLVTAAEKVESRIVSPHTIAAGH